MQKNQTIALLKGDNKSQQTFHRKSSLQKTIKKNQMKIITLSKNVQKKRTQMKNMSQHVNVLLEKQQKKQTKEYPIYNQEYTNPKLIQLKQEKDKIYVQIQQLKGKISIIKEESSQQIQKEFLMAKSIQEQLQSHIDKLNYQKKYLIKTLEENKIVIDQYKMNSSVVDLQKKTEEFQHMKKQGKNYQKQIRILTQKELIQNQYFFDLKAKVEKQRIEESFSINVDETQVGRLIQEINDIYQERKAIEKQIIQKNKQFQKLKNDLQRNIKQKANEIRQLHNHILRINLESKRVNNYFQNKSKILQKSIKQNPQSNKAEKRMEQKVTPKKLMNKVYLALKQQGHILKIGDWANQGEIFSDKDADVTMNIDQLKTIILSTNNDRQIIGIKSLYLTKNNEQLQGKAFYSQQSTTIQKNIQIKTEGLTSIQHGQSQSLLYMKYVYKDGQVIEIGNPPQIISKLNLSYYIIKFIEAQINPQSNVVNSLKITLEDRPIEQKVQPEEEEIHSPDKTSTQRSFSNSNLTLQKRIIPKGKSLKRIREEPTIDYRLMLNKHKLI